MLAAVVGSTALHAMRMQLEFPKWNGGAPYVGMLLGGQRASLTIPALLHLQNRVAHAMSHLNGGHSTLSSARSTVCNVHALISDAVGILEHTAPPERPSGLAKSLTSMMQPPLPSGAVIDLNVAGSPPRLVFSSYLLRASDGVVINARHVAVHPEELEERLAMLTETAREVRSLLAKLADKAESAMQKIDADLKTTQAAKAQSPPPKTSPPVVQAIKAPAVGEVSDSDEDSD